MHCFGFWDGYTAAQLSHRVLTARKSTTGGIFMTNGVDKQTLIAHLNEDLAGELSAMIQYIRDWS